MKTAIAAISFGVCFQFVLAELPPQKSQLRSVSGQFLVHGPAYPGRPYIPPDLATNRNALELDPSILTVSAERIKQALWLEFGAMPDWVDHIHLTLRPARSAEDLVAVHAERFKDSWNYSVSLPAVMERRQFVRALVSVTLLEIANRNATDHAAAVPAWLTEGMTEHLVRTRGRELLLPPPQSLPGGLVFTPTVNEIHKDDPLREARVSLREQSPMSLEELSWPTEVQLLGRDQGRYRHSAALFVAELQQLTGGRQALRTMLGELGRCYNWQTAFLKSFANHFSRQLDVEKWWALQIAHVNGRDPDRLWTFEDSLDKLAQVLKVQVGVRQSQTNLPVQATVSLQNVITKWDALSQGNLLKAKLNELDSARLRIARELLELVDDYRRVLSGYLTQRNTPGIVFAPGKNPPPLGRQLARDVVRKLDELDRRRADIQSAMSQGDSL